MAATYEPIASTTLGSGAATISLSSIPSTFTDLALVFSGGAATNNDVKLFVNGDTSSIYSCTQIRGTGSAASSARYTSGIFVNGADWFGGTNVVALLQFMSYANTNVYKTILSAYASPSSEVNRGVGLVRTTSAISSLEITSSGTIDAGSTVSLFGIKAA